MNEADAATKAELSFSATYEAYFPMIFRFGFRLLGDSEQALDLSQEVFLKLYSVLISGSIILEIKSWLYRTAANLSYDWLRRNQRFSRLIRSGYKAGNPSRDIESEFIKSEDARAVKASLDKLAPRDRLLLILYAEGLPYKEIAKTMELRQSSVGKLIARAVQRLSGEFIEGE